eukprot:705862-Hanusia_phi.AAC.4
MEVKGGGAEGWSTSEEGGEVAQEPIVSSGIACQKQLSARILLKLFPAYCRPEGQHACRANKLQATR